MRISILALTPSMPTACAAIDLAEFEDCRSPLDACIIVPASCDACALQTLEHVTSVPFNEVDAYLEALDCQPGACLPIEISRNPDLQGRCEPQPGGAHRCVALEVHTDPEWASCTTDEDCRVRTASCCECNGDWSRDNLIAVNRAFPGDGQRNCPGGCGGCLPPQPERVSATCSGGFCTLVFE